jgi:hypothetical protein
MANNLLTPTAVTRKALMILHQKLTFIDAIDRQYDSSFAKSGAKIGDSLKIRLPNEYVVRSGATLSTQDTAETSTTLQVATQKGVDLNFTATDLTLSMDDFASRILEPAMAVLAANIEADALTMRKDVYNIVDNDAAAIMFKNIMQARGTLNDNLAPPDNNRSIILSTGHEVTLVDALKGLFNDQSNLSKQYREGMMGRTAGFDFMSSTQMTDHQTGTAAKNTGYLVNGASQTGAALTVNTGSSTFLKGDVITLAGVYRVHPETKVSTGMLQQFVVTADSGASTTSLSISPSIITSGARQNVSGSPASGAAIVKVGAGSSELLSGSMAFHKNAFTFATADLVMPTGVDFSAREVYDGISMRIVRQYDINNDKFPTRLDVLYGFKTIRPQLACRIHADG